MAKVTSKLQVTVPKIIADQYGIRPGDEIEWVTIPRGAFTVGEERDRHKVTVSEFQIAKSEVTVEQYQACVNTGKCTEPDTGGACNWHAGRAKHPVNCVDWDQANQYARFMVARLPSESEWEYAARSGGKNQKYPWGNE
ncbi:MAG: SUMF1/EgtB/PvdO family nonheme iron enzyme, partial [Bacteroidota bacterium]